MSATELKTRLKREHERLADPTRVRLHRAISWLRRSEQEGDDPDARFIFLWIAFNAAYARLFGFEQPEREQLRQFIVALVAADEARVLHKVVFDDFTGPIRTLIQNRFVYEPYWKALREHDASGRWEGQFAAENKAALRWVVEGRTEAVLAIVFDRLYVLRNQLIHGGATWRGGVNREQVRDGARILTALVPTIIRLMLERPDSDWGQIAYPVVAD